MKYTKKNISQIPKEEAHGGSGDRQMLVNKTEMTSPFFAAMTKGYLNSGSTYDWHGHDDIDEICYVIKGNGKFYWNNEVTNYKDGDIFTIPAHSKHKIEALGDDVSEFYFIRIKTK